MRMLVAQNPTKRSKTLPPSLSQMAQNRNRDPDLEDTHKAVFVNTNLDTHLAVMVSHSDTVSDLKNKIMSAHLLCFPVFGEIQISALKVKRKRCLYHLEDSMLVRIAFEGAWFASVDAFNLKQHDDNQIPIDHAVSDQLAGACSTKTPMGASGSGKDPLNDVDMMSTGIGGDVVAEKKRKRESKGEETLAPKDRILVDVETVSKDSDEAFPLVSEIDMRLLSAPRPIFRDSSSDTNSDSSTKTLSDNSSPQGFLEGDGKLNLDSSRKAAGTSGAKNKDGGKSIRKSHALGSKHVTFYKFPRSLSRSKKAKLTATQSQLEDTES